MDNDEERIRRAVENTTVLRPPRQGLATFGITSVHYYLVTEPVYAEESAENAETVLREGKVVVQRPRIVTPYYMAQLEGFSPEAKRYFGMLVQRLGANSPGLLYAYRNEPGSTSIINSPLPSVVARIASELDNNADKAAAIIKGEDTLWDVSLLQFTYELTRHSIEGNLADLGSHGLLGVGADGVPAEARLRIEELFGAVLRDESSPGELKDELERWGLFEEYQDRFFALFKKPVRGS